MKRCGHNVRVPDVYKRQLLFVTLGAGLLRLVCFQGNINALADIVQLGNLGAGFFQLGIFR